jgi:hypothetical protein
MGLGLVADEGQLVMVVVVDTFRYLSFVHAYAK